MSIVGMQDSLRHTFNNGWFDMNLMSRNQEEPERLAVPGSKDFGRIADDICEKALNDAKGHLHPLLRETEIDQLRRRAEFTDAFKLALERSVADQLAVWCPSLQAIYKFDVCWIETRRRWDGSIHLLVKIPRLSKSLVAFGKKLDRTLTHRLQQLGWSRFHKHESVLEMQQVTPNELRHGIGYGAMFYAVHSVPVKVWPQNHKRE